jgi:hypothetical protein
MSLEVYKRQVGNGHVLPNSEERSGLPNNFDHEDRIGFAAEQGLFAP